MLVPKIKENIQAGLKTLCHDFQAAAKNIPLMQRLMRPGSEVHAVFHRASQLTGISAIAMNKIVRGEYAGSMFDRETPVLREIRETLTLCDMDLEKLTQSCPGQKETCNTLRKKTAAIIQQIRI